MNFLRTIKNLTLCAGMFGLTAMTMGCSSSAGGVSALPSTDVSSYDYSLVSTSASTGLSGLTKEEFVTALKAQMSVAPGAVGGYSPAGCRVGEMKDNIFNPSLEIEAMKCRIKAMVAAGLFEEPSTTAQIFKLGISDPDKGDTTIHFKMSKSAEGTYKLLVCQPQFGSDDPKLNEEMSFGKDANGKETFTIHHRNSHEEPTFGDHQGGVFKSQLIMEGTRDGEDGDAKVTARFAGKFTPTGGAETGAEAGQIEFTRVKSTETNTVSAIFQNMRNGGSGTEKVYAKWNKTLGAAKFDRTGTGPGFPCPNDQNAYCCFNPAAPETPTAANPTTKLCTFLDSGNQTYSIATTEASSVFTQEYTVVDTADVSWYQEVVDTAFPTADDVTFAFDDEWDCGVGDAALVTITGEEISKAKDDLEVCEAITDKSFHREGFRSCDHEIVDKAN